MTDRFQKFGYSPWIAFGRTYKAKVDLWVCTRIEARRNRALGSIHLWLDNHIVAAASVHKYSASNMSINLTNGSFAFPVPKGTRFKLTRYERHRGTVYFQAYMMAADVADLRRRDEPPAFAEATKT